MSDLSEEFLILSSCCKFPGGLLGIMVNTTSGFDTASRFFFSSFTCFSFARLFVSSS